MVIKGREKLALWGWKIRFKHLWVFKLLLSLIYAILIVIIIPACSDIAPNYSPKIINRNNVINKQVRFVGQWKGEGRRENLVKDFIRLYSFENQELDIVMKFPEEIMEDYADRTSNVHFVGDMLNKSNPEWDIVRLNNQFSAIGDYIGDPYWAKNYLVDFSEISEFRENTDPKLLTEESKKAWGGIIPGPFLEGSYWTLWTNKNVMAKLGITVKQKGMTMDDFIGYIKAVNQYNQNHPNDYIVPMHEAGDWQTSFVMVFQLYASTLNNDDELFSKNVTENKLKAWYKTLKALEELAQYKPFENGWENIVWSESAGDILQEKCLFYSNGSWMYNIWEDIDIEKTKNVFPNEYPSFNATNTYPSAYFITWGVLKNSPNKDQAVKLLLAMNKPDIADMWVQYTKCPTGIKGNMTDVMFGADQFNDFSVYIQKQYADNIYNFSEELCQNIIGSTDINKIHFRDVLAGKMSADEAMVLIKSYLKSWGTMDGE